MSIVDKVVAAVTPAETAAARAEARVRAKASSSPGDWLCIVIDQHIELEVAFASVKCARDTISRVEAHRMLALLLMGHAIAEEAVLYPALAHLGEKRHSTAGYSEQAAVKVQMAELERLPPMTQRYVEKLEQIRSAVAHHMYEEEGTWFIELRRKAPQSDQIKLTQRFQEEIGRYVGEDIAA
jgi:hypothetical protein